ncbi:hypothetical protein GGR56DRAFT_176892 [Xylariaceae sp. FL0804]|nr:hypothetical protein GGR56DRAFT_176892 [Xylariaceae sp. FL0804]
MMQQLLSYLVLHSHESEAALARQHIGHPHDQLWQIEDLIVVSACRETHRQCVRYLHTPYWHRHALPDSAEKCHLNTVVVALGCRFLLMLRASSWCQDDCVAPGEQWVRRQPGPCPIRVEFPPWLAADRLFLRSRPPSQKSRLADCARQRARAAPTPILR